MSSTWTASIEDKDTRVLAFGSTIKNAQLTLPLNDVSTLSTSFDVTGQDTAAILAQLPSGGVFIRLAENGTTRFWGQLTDLQVEASDDSTVTASFSDVMGALGNVQSVYYRVVYSTQTGVSTFQGKPRAFSGSQSAIVDALLAHRAGPGGIDHYGPLVQPTRSGSSTRTRKVTAGTSTLLEVLKSMSDLAYGVEWYVSPDKTVTIADTLGTDKTSSIMLQFGTAGRGNVMSASSQYLPPRNVIWVNGDDNILRRSAYDETSVDTFGEYSTVLPKTRRASESDEDLANSRLRPAWRQFISVVLEPQFAPRPWTRFYLGDRLHLDLKQGVWSYTGNQRVNQIVFDFDESLVESSITTQFEVS
jgi:hypothetical protein